MVHVKPNSAVLLVSVWMWPCHANEHFTYIKWNTLTFHHLSQSHVSMMPIKCEPFKNKKTDMLCNEKVHFVLYFREQEKIAILYSKKFESLFYARIDFGSEIVCWDMVCLKYRFLMSVPTPIESFYLMKFIKFIHSKDGGKMDSSTMKTLQLEQINRPHPKI